MDLECSGVAGSCPRCLQNCWEWEGTRAPQGRYNRVLPRPLLLPTLPASSLLCFLCSLFLFLAPARAPLPFLLLLPVPPAQVPFPTPGGTPTPVSPRSRQGDKVLEVVPDPTPPAWLSCPFHRRENRGSDREISGLRQQGARPCSLSFQRF